LPPNAIATMLAVSPMLIDTHCHLASRKFDPDRDAVITRAINSGVTHMIAIGCDLEDSRISLTLAQSHDEIHATVGIHPCYVTDIESEDWLDQLRQLAGRPRVAAIGEIGLDYYHPAPDGYSEEAYRTLQQEILTQQLELAAELELNVVIHQRDRDTENLPCWQDLQRIIAPFQGRLRAVFHCFIHSAAEAKKVLDQQHLISFTGVATYKNAKDVQATAAEVPAGQFMLETDSPYLTPVPHRGKRCEPANTRDIAQHIADLRKQSLESLAEETTATANQFFRLT
jgi:TatD DNase family protein